MLNPLLLEILDATSAQVFRRIQSQKIRYSVDLFDDRTNAHPTRCEAPTSDNETGEK